MDVGTFSNRTEYITCVNCDYSSVVTPTTFFNVISYGTRVKLI